MSRSSKRIGEVRVEADCEISGFVYDPTDLARRFVVELLADGEPIAVMRAALFDTGLHESGIADGCYGFAFSPPEGIGKRIVAVTVANDGEVVGGAIDLSRIEPTSPKPERDGVRWIGGLRFEAWIESSSEIREAVVAEIDGETVATDAPDGWAPTRHDLVIAAANRYTIILPARFADGQMRRARFRTQTGRELAGSPCVFVAFADPPPLSGFGLRELRPPQSLPFRDFEGWRRAYPSRLAADHPLLRVAVILLGAGSLTASLGSLAAQAGCDWIAAAICESGDGVALDVGSALAFLEGEGEDYEFVVVAAAGAVFDANALALLASALQVAPLAPIAYSDIAVRAEDGSLWPLVFPAFDQERLLEQGYPARLFALRRRLAISLLQERVAGDVFALLFSSLQALGKAAPAHVPEFLATLELAQLRAGADRLADAVNAHLQFLQIEAQATPIRHVGLLARAQIVRPQRDSVSLIVEASAADGQVESCLAAAAKALHGQDAEVLLVGDAESLARLGKLDSTFRRLETAHPGSLMHSANAAATSANGDLLVLLDPRLGALDGVALRELLGRAAADGVGAVGPLQIDDDGLVVSAGRVLGPGLGVGDAFENHPADAPSYGDLLHVAHEVSAVSALGMVTRKELFRDVDGFDLARFRRRFAEVDYCLKLRARGARVVLAPAARLVTPSARQAPATSRAPFLSDLAEDAELRQLRSRWGEALAADPFYNPNLALDRPYGGLAWPPRRRDIRMPDILAPRPTPPGF